MVIRDLILVAVGGMQIRSGIGNTAVCIFHGNTAAIVDATAVVVSFPKR